MLIGAAHSRLWMVHRCLLLTKTTPGQGSVAPTREVVAVRARPERPLAPCPGRLADARSRPNQALRDVRPFSAARKAGIHRDTAPRGNRLHYPRALVCRCQSTRPLQRWTPGKHTGVGAADRARRPLEPDLRATFAFRMDAEIPCGKGIFDNSAEPTGHPRG